MTALLEKLFLMLVGVGLLAFVYYLDAHDDQD